MQNWERERSGPEARDRGMRLLRKLTTGVAVVGVAAVGLFAAIGAATIPGTAQAAQKAQTAPAASSSSSSSSSDDTVAAPAAMPQPASAGPVHAVTGGS